MLMKRMAFLIAAAATATPPILTVHAQTMRVPLPSGRALTEYYTTMPQADPGDYPANWSPRQNVIDSHRYEQRFAPPASAKNAVRSPTLICSSNASRRSTTNQAANT